MILAGFLVAAAVIGTFVFVKNNPKKTAKIEQVVKAQAKKVADAAEKKLDEFNKN